MSLSCLLLLLFVLKLVNHRNYELEILYVIIYSYIGNTYFLPMLLAPFSTTPPLPPPPPPPPPPAQKKKYFFFQIWILCQNSLTRELKIRVVGFVLKKLLTFFENLILPHALPCINGCFFVFYLIWHSGILFWFHDNPPTPPHHPTLTKK